MPWFAYGFGSRHASPFPGEELAWVKQIHSADCVQADGATGCVGEGDALITNHPNVIVSIRTADCLPLLLVDEEHRAVAAVHAGWRGTAAEIAATTLSRMASAFGTEAKSVWVAIGPGIGVCCYQVGADVGERFRKYFPEAQQLPCVDLAEANRRQLLELGVPDRQILKGAPCTQCHPADLHSFRRDGRLAGRMISAIKILKGAN